MQVKGLGLAEGGFPPFRRTELVFFCLLLGPERKCSCRAEGSVHSTKAVVGRRKRRKGEEERKEGGEGTKEGRKRGKERGEGKKGLSDITFPGPTYYRLSKELQYPCHGPCSSAWPSYKLPWASVHLAELMI